MYLNKVRPNMILLNVEQLAVLLYNVRKAMADPKIGFEDGERTIEGLCSQINKTVYIYRDAIESALWSSNMLHEGGKFWHPKGLTFNQFSKQVCPKEMQFNKIYNLFEFKKGEDPDKKGVKHVK